MADQDVLLKITASSVSDLEQLKLQVQNRLRQLTRDEADSDGKIRGLGLSEDHEVVVALAGVAEIIQRQEEAMVKVLERQVRTHPCGPWAKRTKGAGLKTTGRLLGAIGDPYLRPGHDDPETEEWVPEQPRTLNQLYSYCGMSVRNGTTDGSPGGHAPAHRRGERGNWSAEARLRLYVMADRQVIGGFYRPVYDMGREKYANAVHAEVCVRCGPSGSPAQIGSPLSKAHQHARALRLVSKAILADLYAEAKEYHQLAEDTDTSRGAMELAASSIRTRIPVTASPTVPAALLPGDTMEPPAVLGPPRVSRVNPEPPVPAMEEPVPAQSERRGPGGFLRRKKKGGGGAYTPRGS
jgi:hypothetical protein